MIQWCYYPRSKRETALARSVVEIFIAHEEAIASATNSLASNEVLSVLCKDLSEAGFRVETGKREDQKVPVPVLFGRNGRVEKCFYADAYHVDAGFVIEIEAGRGVVNNQFLKDLFQACMMHEVRFLAVAIRTTYRNTTDFEIVCRFFDTLYASNRLSLPLEGILIVGY